MSGLPRGWAEARIDDVAELKLGKMLDAAKNRGEFSSYLRNVNVRWGTFDLDDLLKMRLTADEKQELSIRDGDLLICEGGEPGRSAVWAFGNTDLTFQKALIRARSRTGIDPHLLSAHLRNLALSDRLSDHFTGTTIKHLPQAALAKIQLPVPPTAEQRRIVAKIDSLSAKSSRARDHLDHIPQLVEKYKQVLLEAAAQGELTRTWRDHSATPQPKLGSLSDLTAIPIRNGLSVKGSDSPPGVRSLRLSALRTRVVNVKDVRYLPISASDASKYELSEEDILVSRGNGNKSLVGIASIVPKLANPTIFPDTAFRLRLKPGTSSGWLTLVWNAPPVRQQIEATAKTTAGIWKISQTDLASIIFPIPALSEQHEIVRRIESAFTWIDRLAAEATSARKLIDRLDQAVLAKAFRGELVPQDPNDEPASVLLERIRAERAAAPKPKRGRRPRLAAS